MSQNIRIIATHLTILLCISILIGCNLSGAESSESNKPPNIVLIYADDLGFGDLSSFGHPTIRTPHIDSLAMQGMRLTSFYNAAAVCTPSRAALLTGRYPQRVGLSSVIMPESDFGLSSEEITMAEILRDNGYATMMVGKWHLGHTSDDYMPVSHGFDEYFGLKYSNDMILPWVQTERPLRYFRNLDPIPGEVDQTQITVNYTSEAVQFIEEKAGDPFFLYLSYTMPHVPIYAPQNRQGTSLAGKYGDVIETIDWSVGEVVKALKNAGVTENTLLVFTSDNGPWNNMPDRMFSEDVQPDHEVIKPWDGGSSGILRGAKAETYEGGFRVPAIIRWPGHVPANSVSSDIVTTMDLFSTLVTAGGGEIPTDRTIDGNNVLNHIRGEEASPTSTLFYFFEDNLLAVRNGEWKLLTIDPDQPELYHLNIDPGEKYNRADEFPELVEKLSSMMREFDEAVYEW